MTVAAGRAGYSYHPRLEYLDKHLGSPRRRLDPLSQPSSQPIKGTRKHCWVGVQRAHHIILLLSCICRRWHQKPAVVIGRGRTRTPPESSLPCLCDSKRHLQSNDQGVSTAGSHTDCIQLHMGEPSGGASINRTGGPALVTLLFRDYSLFYCCAPCFATVCVSLLAPYKKKPVFFLFSPFFSLRLFQQTLTRRFIPSPNPLKY